MTDATNLPPLPMRADEGWDADDLRTYAREALAPVVARAEKAEAEAERLTRLVAHMGETLERAEDYLPVPPERNCSCHLSPPCGDCVDFSDLRDLYETIRGFRATITDNREIGE